MNGRLAREIGLGGAIVVGLGSILGTGAFVSIALASARWGDALLVAIPVAAVVALCSGLSSAYLAARYPVAGGTYEYAYDTLGAPLGFSAGWLFLLAKTASAAAAALGIAGYLGAGSARLVAVLLTAAFTGLVATGLRRTAPVNAGLVSVTVLALIVFAIVGMASSADGAGSVVGEPTALSPLGAVPAAIAFLFVAYTGFGRIATMAEEVVSPARVIPRAILATLAVATLLYVGVALGGRSIGGPEWGAITDLGLSPATLLPSPYRQLVSIGAVTAMAGVLLNLVLGLSRVWLAMGRRGDMPGALARLDSGGRPLAAVLTAGSCIAVVALLGDLGLAWSFSAFTVLLYYGVTNLAALRLDPRRGTAWAGLASCLALSFFVTPVAWAAGAGLLLLGLVWHQLQHRV